MLPADALPSEGHFVRVRGRRYLVEKVEPSPHEDTAVRLACVDDDAAGASLEVLWERELDAALLGAEAFGGAPIRRFDRPDLFSAYLDTLRWGSVTSTRPDLFQSPFRAGISIKAHQLEPLRKALLLPRVNLLIADDVGLGKTIEAGLILRELLLRQRVRRVIVACPPSVVLQWREELESRFGLAFRVLDRAYVLRMRRERGHAVNPWGTHPRLIVSHALLRDESYAGLLRALLEESREGSLLILDEAHNAAPASSARYAIDSRFTRVVRDLAHRFEHRLFLSATPHNGHSNSFSALLEILDNTRFCRGAPVAPEDRDAVVVRRLKRDLRHTLPDEYPVRKVVQHVVEGLPDDAPELALSQLLERYRALREQRIAALPKAAQAAAGLVLISLQKRLLSSVHAFARTLEVHRRTLENKRSGAAAAKTTTAAAPSEAQLKLLADAPGMDDDQAELDEASVRAEEEAQLARATAADPTVPSSEELELLRRMSEIAGRARDLPDPRIHKLVAWIRENLCPDLAPLGKGTRRPPQAWNNRRLIVFTEYADTKDYLVSQLRAALAEPERTKGRLATFHGGIADEAREEIKDAFNADPKIEPLRILICTDAAREGVNLQNHCADLFHFDLPWNPSRVEQRNGRIDRTLQRAKEVRCHYFLFAQRPEDRVLETMVKKTLTIQDELGSAGAVIEGKLAVLLERGIPLSRIGELVSAIGRLEEEPARAAAKREELEAAESRAKIDEQVAVLRKLLGQSQEHLEIDSSALIRAINASLAILGEPPLEPLTIEGPHGPIAAYRFPDLGAKRGADPTFVPLLDRLREPAEKGEQPWEWRKRAKLRPVVFEDPGSLGSGVVHLHLEHPLVQRLLGRFSAQGFVHDDLSRACVLRTEASIPHVVLYGRLALYGPGAARLHDEMLATAAQIDGKKLQKLPDPEEALRLVKASLADPRLGAAPAEWAEQAILPRLPADIEALRAMLERRTNELEARARRLLEGRGKKEGAALRKVVTDQGRRLAQHRADVEKRYGAGSAQLSLDFSAAEREQLLDDLAYWDRRIAQLGPEADAEAKRIEEHYAVRSVRREVTGIVYLWPRSG